MVAIDDFSDGAGIDAKRVKWETFDLCRMALGHSEERCKRFEMSVYDVSPETLGMFDVVFFFGTIYHLRHPLLALDKLSAVCTGTIHIESAVADDYSAYRDLGMGHGGHMVMEFYLDAQYGNNPSNWWVPTTTCLAHMVRAAGFKDVMFWKGIGVPTRVPECRGFVKGTK